MGLARGTRLGAYEILDVLGVGGMGEVYRARDTTLYRHIALKVLPDVFAADPERLARFQREARTLAGLNHPHIAQIYGLEDVNGVRAIAMELVEGEDLAARLRRGAVPLEEALPIARQIADALAEAHEHGVIHRDLKPANIKVRDDGTVKVLDFGLAKAFDPANGAGPQLANSPTLTGHATTMGVLLGTAPYMAPEQARGQPVDKRADIWAFGVVLYEMLTGRRAFDGNNVSDVLAAVIKETPSLEALPPATPPSIRRLLRRCLEKDHRERLSDMSAVRLEIRDALSGELPSAPGQPLLGPRVLQRWGPAVALLTLTVLAGLVGISYFRTPAELSEMRFEIPSPSSSEPFSFALSPDGRQLVFVATDKGQSRLWLQRLDSVTAQPLADTEGATFPFWKPDSRSVGFFSAGKLMRLDLGSGSPRPLANVIAPHGASWSPNGVILFAPTVLDRLWRVSETGGDAAPVTNLDLPRQTAHLFPHFLPDGRRFLYYARGTADGAGIHLGSLDSPSTTRLTAADTAAAYLPPGWLLFVRQQRLVAQRFDLSGAVLSGEPETVADPAAFAAVSSAGAFSVAGTGTVVYRASGGDIQPRQLTWFDRKGNVVGTLGPPDLNNGQSPALSPDGRQVAIARSVQGNRDIFVVLDPLRSVRLTLDGSIDATPVWSPDGSWIAFRSNRTGTFDLYRKRADNVGSEQLLVRSPLHKNVHDWSRAGNLLYSVDFDPNTRYDLWWLPLDNAGAGTSKPFLRESYEERSGQFSPDGRWVAYVSDESGRREIYIRPFPGPGAASPVSTAGGISPRWEKAGKELYYIAPDSTLMAAPISVKGDSLAVGVPISLFQTQIVGGGRAQPPTFEYAVAPNGRFLINSVTADPPASPMTILLNWKPKS